MLRLHAALTQRDLWRALILLGTDPFGASSLALEIARGGGLLPPRQYRHRSPAAPRETRALDPVAPWLAGHPGAPAVRLSDVVPPGTLRDSNFHARVMRRQDWDWQLSLVAWRGRTPLARLDLRRSAAAPDFSSRDLRLAETLQPHFETALRRVLAHEEALGLGEQLGELLEEAPVGWVLLDWELRPLWFNREGAHAVAVWNHGERSGPALRARNAFRVPPRLADACVRLRDDWENAARRGDPVLHPIVISEDGLGLHAQIALSDPGTPATLRPAFRIQLDYRRPRGDRARPLSAGAVALLARLSAREREVAIRVREGLSTREIAAELHRSPLTIKTQLASIFDKLELRTRTRVAALLNR